MVCAGIDVGSRTTKVVLWNTERHAAIAQSMADQGVDQRRIARDLLDNALHTQGLQREHVRRIVATGYGRDLLDFADTTITEITCHARGVHHEAPDVRTIIEIGGQDSKVMRLEGRGAVRDFAMNDRCAAGSGRFLEVVAVRLGVPFAGWEDLIRQSRKPTAISSMCVVFAETEIVGLLASGAQPADILAGVQAAIVTRVAAMVGRSPAQPVYFTGGVALVSGMAEALGRAIGQSVVVARNPCMTGALGAALLAARH